MQCVLAPAPPTSFLASLTGSLSDFASQYANNQWRLHEEIAENLDQTSFRKALDIAEGAVSILDTDGQCFRRVWCSFEMFLAQTDGVKKYDVYTAVEGHDSEDLPFHCRRSAVGILDGMAKFFEGPEERDAVIEEADNKAEREADFPTARAMAAFTLKLQDAQASVDTDKIKILNTIAGRSDLTAKPPDEHPTYDKLNASLRGRFALVVLRPLLDAGDSAALDEALQLLKVCGRRKIELGFSGCEAFDARAMELIATHLPPELEELNMLRSGLTAEHVPSLAAALAPAASKVVQLELSYNQLKVEGAQIIFGLLETNTTLTSVGLNATVLCGLDSGEYTAEGFIAIAKMLEVNRTLRSLSLDDNKPTNRGEDMAGMIALSEALKANSTLQTLTLATNDLGDEDAKHLADALTVNKTLTSLKLNDNPINKEGWCAIFAALRDNKDNQIEEWDLSQNRAYIGQPEIVEVLSEYISGSTAIRSLKCAAAAPSNPNASAALRD